MNFLNKARKKAEEALKEISTQAQGLGQSHQENTYQELSYHYSPQITQNSPLPPQFNQQQQPNQPPQVHGNQPSYQQQGYLNYPPQQPNQYFPPPVQGHLPHVSPPPPSQPPNQYSPPPSQHSGSHVPPQNYPRPPPTPAAREFSSPPQCYRGPATVLPPPPPPPTQVQPDPPSSQIEKKKCLATEPVLTSHTKFFCFNSSVGVSDEAFSICSHCFQSNIAAYSLASCFREYRTTDENMRFLCDFGFPRVRNIWYSHCIPRNTIQPLVDFSRFGTTLVPCNGSTISSPGPFWITRNEAVPELAICQTCFEIFLRLTPFEGYFENKTYPETRDWSCDLALPFFKRALTIELEKTNPSFQDLVSEYNTRFKIVPCTGPEQPIASFENSQSQSLIFSAVDGTGNICFACYSDHLANTPLEDVFVGAALTTEQKTTVTCDLALPYSKSALEIAIQRKDIEVWRSAVGIQGKVGVCFGRKGITEEEWEKKVAEHGSLAKWYYINGYPSIEICPSCYWLYVKLFNADSLFSPITRSLRAGIVRMCFLAASDTPLDTKTESPDFFENSLTWRGRRLRIALGIGFEINNFSRLLSEANLISQELPPCGGNERGFKRPSGRKWYGRISQNQGSDSDCTIVMCEECHSRTVKGSLLEAHFSNDLTDAAYQNEGESGFGCQPYSNRARKELRNAAQSGDLASFARYWNIRDALQKKKDQWGPILAQQTLKMQMQNHQQSMNLMVKMNASRNALARLGSAGVVEAAMSDPGVRYGNSQIGYDSYTQGRAEAEQDFRNAQKMDIGTGAGMGSIAETQRLILLAAQDEKAFQQFE